MSKFSIYPFGNARAGSHFPILSPRFSKFVTSRFSQPWKFSYNQQLRAERKSVKGLKTPLISWTPHSGALTGLFPGKGLSLFYSGYSDLSWKCAWPRSRWEKHELQRWHWQGTSGRAGSCVVFILFSSSQINIQMLYHGGQEPESYALLTTLTLCDFKGVICSLWASPCPSENWKDWTAQWLRSLLALSCLVSHAHTPAWRPPHLLGVCPLFVSCSSTPHSARS